MKKKLLFLTTAFTLSTSLYAQQSSEQTNAMLAKTDRQFFIENKGQWPSEVLYLTRIGGLDAWITQQGVLYDFFQLEEIPNSEKTMQELPDKLEHKDYTRIGHRVLYELQNTSANPSKEGKQKQAGYYNYFICNDPSKHASYVGLYKEALVKNVYNGIDIRYYFDRGSLRYDYIVHPEADPAQIQFTLKGSDKTFVNAKGNLVFTTRFGEVQLAELYCYQGNKEVSSKFIATDKHYSIQVADYDKTQDLIIDPLIYSTYLGGGDSDIGYSIAIDGSGNAYVTGETKSTNYDTTTGAYRTTRQGGVDVFVTKLNATGTGLIYSTYIGGGNGDVGYSIAIDGSGNAYVTGRTNSSNYPTTTGAYQTTRAGTDVFVTQLNATGSGLVYSTYIGGSNTDEGRSIAIDGSGNAYVTGFTNSTNYDTTSGAYQTTFGGSVDVFVTQLNATGTALVYSTYLGGSASDIGYSIAIDGSGNAYVTGETQSADYDTTTEAFQTTSAENRDVFVTQLNATGTGLVYSTYIGGNGNDYGRSIAVDGSGNAYVTGYTNSTNYPTTTGAFQTTSAVGNEVFVTQLNATGTALVYSTYLGGNNGDVGYSIAIDGSGNAYVTGQTSSNNYDITPGAYQTTNAGSGDVFVTKLNATGTNLIYSTYLGGTGTDEGRSIAIDGSGNAYVTGRTNSSNYDTTSGAYQTTNGGGYDVFVTQLEPIVPLPIELLSFEATLQDNGTVHLLWATASEINTDYFIIEKSKNADAWQTVGERIPAAGNSHVVINYETVDPYPYSGISYYRLKQVDIDGSFSYSPVVAINNEIPSNLSSPISLYPNPSNGQFTVASESLMQQITVIDALGKEVITYRPLSSISTINLSHMAGGVYWLRITSEKGMRVKKLVITK